MRTLLFILFLSPLLALSQKTNSFLRLTDARGQQIKGNGAVKGFERNIELTSFSSTPGKENTQIYFTMLVQGAGADFRRALVSGEYLLNGLLTQLTTGPDGRTLPQYTIKMEKISVLSCTESMGCNAVMNTSVTLKATRIGWTYFSTNRTGVIAVANKYGWDAENRVEWNSF